MNADLTSRFTGFRSGERGSWAWLRGQSQKATLAILVWTAAAVPAYQTSAQEYRTTTPVFTNPPTQPTVTEPRRQFDVNGGDTRRGTGPLAPQGKAPDKKKIKSIFDKAKEPPPTNKQAGPVETQTATGSSKKKAPKERNKPEVDRPPTMQSPAEVKSQGETVRRAVEVDTGAGDPDGQEKKRVAVDTAEGGLPTLKAGDVKLGPQMEVQSLDPRIYQKVPGHEGVELPKGGPTLPGTGLPGDDGIGGLRGGLQGGLNRPVIDESTGEEAYQDRSPFDANPATSPSGALGDAGGYLGAAGQAYGGKHGRTMEQLGGVLQSGSLGQAAGRGADMAVPGSGAFVEALANGDTAGMVGAGATAAGNLASDLAIGLIVGFVGGGLLGMAIGYALSATGAGRAIADGVTAGIKWIAEKVGLGGSTPPPEPAPEPEPPPESGSYDENYSKKSGKKGPSVINENQIKPLQDKLQRDLLGEKRDAEQQVDTSDAPPPSKVAVKPGCDPEDLASSGGGKARINGPLQIKDMELSFDKA